MGHTMLVLGGTGTLGAPVARRLRDDGFDVRVVSRDPERARRTLGDGFEIHEGDVRQPHTLEPAFDGCWGVHVSVDGPERQAAELAASLAADHRLARIGYVSGATVDEANRWFPMIEEKLAAERAVAESGVPWTIFRPSWPFETLARFVRGGRAAVVGKHPAPYHWFAADDFARMVSAAYRTDRAIGRRLWILGPEAIRMHDALDRYRAALHPEIAAVGSLPTWLGRVMGTVTRNEGLKFASRLMAYFDRVGELGDPAEANALLGQPTLTLDRWLEARKQAPAEH